MRPLRLVGLTVVFAVASIAWLALSGGDSVDAAPPAPIPPGFLPVTLENGALRVLEYEVAGEGFASAGERSLLVDAQLWEVRRGARLVGTAQVATLKPKVSAGSERDRNDILGQILPTAATRIEIAGVEVHAAATADKSMYIWFGDGLFVVLQLKVSQGSGINDPESIVRELITHQVPSGRLELPPDPDEANNVDEDDE